MKISYFHIFPILILLILCRSEIYAEDNDSTVVLDSIAYRIWTDTTHYAMTQFGIPIKFQYLNLKDDTLHFVSASSNIVLLYFTRSDGVEFLHPAVSGTSHYYIEPFDTLTFSEIANSGMVEWSPGIYTAKGRPDNWNSSLPYAEVSVSIVSSLSATDEPTIPDKYKLHQNFPNPFNPVTTIRYELPRFSHVRLSVYDILGREVAVLGDRDQRPGVREVQWNASNVPSGIYFVQMVAGDFRQVRKVMVLK